MVLKTFDDGSQMTGAGLVVAGLICTATAVGGAVAAVKFSNWRHERWLKKHGYHNGS